MAFETFLLALISSAISSFVFYWIVRSAVRGGINDAFEDRRKRRTSGQQPQQIGNAPLSALSTPTFSKVEPQTTRTETTLITRSGKVFERPNTKQA